MKTKHTLILVAFIVSLGFNVYSVNSGDPEVSPCDNTGRYNDELAGGGMDMPVSSLKTLVLSYKTAHQEDRTAYKTTGFMLSKRMCDELFKNAAANALTLDLFVDNGQLNLAVKATHTAKSGIDQKAGTGYYILQTFCPDDCSAW